MKKSILNLIWWFAAPFIVTFFYIILISSNIPSFSVYTLVRLNIFLIALPLFVYWTSGLYLKKDFHRREQIAVSILLISMIFAYFLDIQKFDNWVIITYLVFFLSVLQVFIFSFFKLNQYISLLASFLIVVLIMMILLQKDFYIIIVILLVFSGLLMYLFVDNEIDNSKNVYLSYGIGFLSTLIFTGLVFLLEKMNLFEIISITH